MQRRPPKAASASFLSNKGGVGKSTLAVNVATALALKHPDDVLLIDTSLQIGSCAMLLDIKPTTSIVDAVRERDRLDETLLRHLTLRARQRLAPAGRADRRARRLPKWTTRRSRESSTWRGVLSPT